MKCLSCKYNMNLNLECDFDPMLTGRPSIDIHLDRVVNTHFICYESSSCNILKL